MARTHTSLAMSYGRDAGHAAATWAEISEANAARMAELIDNCEADEYLPAMPDLSGEWADGETPATLADALGIAVDDERIDSYCDAWERGADSGYWAEIWRMIRAYS